MRRKWPRDELPAVHMQRSAPDARTRAIVGTIVESQSPQLDQCNRPDEVAADFVTGKGMAIDEQHAPARANQMHGNSMTWGAIIAASGSIKKPSTKNTSIAHAPSCVRHQSSWRIGQELTRV